MYRLQANISSCLGQYWLARANPTLTSTSWSIIYSVFVESFRRCSYPLYAHDFVSTTACLDTKWYSVLIRHINPVNCGCATQYHVTCCCYTQPITFIFSFQRSWLSQSLSGSLAAYNLHFVRSPDRRHWLRIGTRKEVTRIFAIMKKDAKLKNTPDLRYFSLYVGLIGVARQLYALRVLRAHGLSSTSLHVKDVVLFVGLVRPLLGYWHCSAWCICSPQKETWLLSSGNPSCSRTLSESWRWLVCTHKH